MVLVAEFFVAIAVTVFAFYIAITILEAVIVDLSSFIVFAATVHFVAVFICTILVVDSVGFVRICARAKFRRRSSFFTGGFLLILTFSVGERGGF